MTEHQRFKNWTELPNSAGLYVRSSSTTEVARLPANEQQKLDRIVRELTAKVNLLAEKLPKK